MNPSGVMMKPDPLPAASRPLRRSPFLRTSIFTTDGLTSSAALTTAFEYASSNGPSETGAFCAAPRLFNSPDSPETGHTSKSFSTVFILQRLLPAIVLSVNLIANLSNAAGNGSGSISNQPNEKG